MPATGGVVATSGDGTIQRPDGAVVATLLTAVTAPHCGRAPAVDDCTVRSTTTPGPPVAVTSTAYVVFAGTREAELIGSVHDESAAEIVGERRYRPRAQLDVHGHLLRPVGRVEHGEGGRATGHVDGPRQVPAADRRRRPEPERQARHAVDDVLLELLGDHSTGAGHHDGADRLLVLDERRHPGHDQPAGIDAECPGTAAARSAPAR